MCGVRIIIQYYNRNVNIGFDKNKINNVCSLLDINLYK